MNRYLASIFSLSLNALCHAGEPEPLRLPEPLSGLVSKAIEIKTEAMKIPAMRSEEGKLGKQMENIMNQIADLAGEEIAEQAQKTQEHDIRAKIILWAKDRKKRPAEYERFAKFYMNRPAYGKDANTHSQTNCGVFKNHGAFPQTLGACGMRFSAFPVISSFPIRP